MEDKTTARNMDELGRIVIPANILEELGWGTGTKLEVAISDVTIKTITIREVSPCCSLCRAQSESLTKVEKGYICGQCAEKLK